MANQKVRFWVDDPLFWLPNNGQCIASMFVEPPREPLKNTFFLIDCYRGLYLVANYPLSKWVSSPQWFQWINPTYPIYNWGYNPLTNWDEPPITTWFTGIIIIGRETYQPTRVLRWDRDIFLNSGIYNLPFFRVSSKHVAGSISSGVCFDSHLGLFQRYHI